MTTYLTNDHAKAILKLGTPIMLGQMGVILVGFVDNIMVGHYGTAELAAASFVNNFINLAFILGMGFSYGLIPLVSGAYASKNGRLKTLLKSSIVANIVVGILLTLVMGFFYWKIEWLDQPRELLPLIRPYYLIHLVSIIPLMIFNAYKQFGDGVSQTTVSMKAILISNAVNILFNYLLIYGAFGFPELGLIGAGLATLLSRFVMLGILLWAVHRTKRFRTIFSESGSDTGRVEKAALSDLTRLGIPSGMQMGLESGSFSIAVIMIGWLGAVPLAAHQVVNTISTLGFMVYYGLSSAVAIRVGYFYELRKERAIENTVKSALALHFALALVLIVVLLIFRNQVGQIFTTDEAVLALVSQLIFILCIYQPGDVYQILYSNALRGLHDVKFTAWAALFSYAVMTVGAGYLFGIFLGYGVMGVWSGFPIGLTTLGLLLYLRYRYVLKKLPLSHTDERPNISTPNTDEI